MKNRLTCGFTENIVPHVLHTNIYHHEKTLERLVCPDYSQEMDCCLARAEKQEKRLCPGAMTGGGQSRFYRGGRTGYSGRLTEMASSSSWACSMMPGASSITSRPLLFLGKAIQSRMLSRPAKRLTKRSRP